MQQVTSTDHAHIRAWANERGGSPAIVVGTDDGLRFDWGEQGDEHLERISWDEFFSVFNEYGLAFAHIENDDSSVYEFVSRYESVPNDDENDSE
ncbi:MAG TPA: hypothetical protein VGP13_03090 [Candidatus Paceibacterota bacterium]|jgi:hypothetical protein|nr:hypothetical protein [Candidatus Paceibacterota bacterium]